MRRYTEIFNVEGISSGGTGLVKVPGNRRYHSIDIFPSDGATVDPASLIDSVRLTVNSGEQISLSVADIISLIKTHDPHGFIDTSKFLPLIFSDFFKKTVIGEEVSSWDLFGNNIDVSIEVKFKTGLSAPNLRVFASYDFVQNQTSSGKFAAVVRRGSTVYNLGSGQNTIPNFPIFGPLHALHFRLSTGSISDIEILRNGESIVSAPVTKYNLELAKFGFTSDFDLSVIFNRERQFTSPLIVERGATFEIRPTLSDAATLTLIHEVEKNGFN